jgi:hypothetical protein
MRRKRKEIGKKNNPKVSSAGEKRKEAEGFSGVRKEKKDGTGSREKRK